MQFVFRLSNDRLVMELHGSAGRAHGEERELGRAIIDALMDECSFDDESTRLVKLLNTAGSAS